MEVAKWSSDAKQLALCSFVEAAVVNSLLAAQNSITCLLMLTSSLLNDELPDWIEKRFPMEELHRVEKPGLENKDGSDTEDDDEDDDDDNAEPDDDAGDEDFSGGEEGEDDDEADPEEDAEANGNGGSDDEDDDDDDGFSIAIIISSTCIGGENHLAHFVPTESNLLKFYFFFSFSSQIVGDNTFLGFQDFCCEAVSVIMDGLKQDGNSVDSFLKNYKLGKTLGIGSFGKVKIAEHALTGHKVAVKILNRKKIKNMDMEEKVRREIKILRLFMHPHIIRLYEVVETNSDIYVVMEFVKSGELFDYIVEKGRLHEEEARVFFQQIISGVEYCHRNMVVHRDLKPENLLLDSKHNVKIADFGLSNIMRDGHFLKTSCGSPNYAAPEVISGKLYAGPEVDVWSCGVILYALLCGTLPFDDENIPNLFKKIKGGIYTLPSHLSACARDLIPRMLIVDPMKRMSIPEIRAHPWFQAHLPRYLAVPPPDTTQQAKKIDEDILQEMIKMGFDRAALVESLRNRVQNEGTVSYYLLLDNRFRVSNGYLGAEFQETVEFGYNRMNPSETVASPRLAGVVDHQQFGVRQLPADRKWALGLQSRAHPREIMTEVLKALQELKVYWKKIGHYNMKCRWVPGHSEGNSIHGTDYFGDESAIVENEANAATPNVIKFEVQLYKTREDKYLLDMQRVQGPQLLFLDLCAAFLAQLRVL